VNLEKVPLLFRIVVHFAELQDVTKLKLLQHQVIPTLSIQIYSSFFFQFSFFYWISLAEGGGEFNCMYYVIYIIIYKFVVGFSSIYMYGGLLYQFE